MACFSNDDRVIAENLTRLLSGVCRRLTTSGNESFISGWPELAEWWYMRRKVEERLAEEERAKARFQEIKKAALAKLTAEERAALGH